MTQLDQFDLMVIGGGSGGVRAARIAASLGATVAIIEDTHWGGTCVNVGCVPKKMYHYVASARDDIELARAYGWQVNVAGLDWSVFYQAKTAEINRLQHIYRSMLNNTGVQVIDGFATLLDAHRVQVGEQTYHAKHILLAVGCTPVMPDIAGIEHAIMSDQLFAQATLPRKMLVFGGGYIACEMASTYHKLGVDVRLITRGQFLKQFDHQTTDFLKTQLHAEGLQMQEHISIQSMSKTAQGIAVSLSDGSVDQVDTVLIATGRKPRFEGLGLDKLGIKRDGQGLIAVNEHYQTNIPSIYAVGDIVEGADLTPVALAQGMYVARHLFGAQPVTPPDLSHVATTIFTHPQVASIGLTEEEVIKRRISAKVFTSSFRHLKYTTTELHPRTFIKMLVDEHTDQILGIHLVGLEVGEIMQGFAVAVQAKLTKTQLDQTIGIHPTVAEELVTMREPNRFVSVQ
jgi:glutathione reductase (NADPH)